MHDSVPDRQEWESELEAIEEQLGEDPAETLPELDSLVGRMLEEAGFELEAPLVGEGESHEVVSEFLAAREITEASERGSGEISLGDIAAAVNGYRAAFSYLISSFASPGAELEAE